MDKKKSNTAMIWIVLVMVLIAAFGGITIVRRYMPAYTAKSVMQTLPPVSKTVVDKNNNEHTLHVRFSVEIPKSAEGKVNMQEVQDMLQESLQHVSYDKLQAPGSVEYLKNLAREKLRGTISEEEISEIYIGDIAVDFPIDEPKDKNNRNEIFEGLFENANK